MPPVWYFYQYSTKMGVEKGPPDKKSALDLFLCCLICYNRKKKKEGKKAMHKILLVEDDEIIRQQVNYWNNGAMKSSQ